MHFKKKNIKKILFVAFLLSIFIFTIIYIVQKKTNSLSSTITDITSGSTTTDKLTYSTVYNNSNSIVSGSTTTDRLGEAGIFLGSRPSEIKLAVNGNDYIIDVSDISNGTKIQESDENYNYDIVPFEYGFYFWAYTENSGAVEGVSTISFDWECTIEPVEKNEYTIPNDFIRTDGEKLVDGYGNEYKFLAFNARLNHLMGSKEGEHYMTSSFELDEDAYSEMKEMGFTGIKLIFSYDFFVNDDNKPYEYADGAWEWIDQNIEWAKKYNLKIMLNAHITQGGAHYTGECQDFWEYPENQDYWIALWKEIARRYANEPTIIGYGLLNEPHIKELDSVALIHWANSDLQQRCIDAIREVDKNHVLSIDRALGVLSDNWQWYSNDYYGNNWQFALVNDHNMMVEWHDYKPGEFIRQNGSNELLNSYPGQTYTFGIYDKGYVDTNRSWQLRAEQLITQHYFDQYNKEFPVFIGEFGGTGIASFDDDETGGEFAVYLTDKLSVMNENEYNYSFHLWMGKSMGYIYQTAPASYKNAEFRRTFLEDLFKTANAEAVSDLDDPTDNPTITGISIKTAPSKTTYIKGEELDLTGGIITVTYEDGSTIEIPMTSNEVETTGYDANSLNEQIITVTYAGKTATFKVTVKNEITRISVKTAPSKTTYIKGEELDLTGGIITVTYEDGSTIEIPMTSNEVEITGYNGQEEGEQEITVTYAEKTATFKVTVRNEITGISIKSAPSKTTYIKGEELDLTGGIITVTYEDGSIVEVPMTSSEVEITGYNEQEEGEQEITVTYAGETATFIITVKNEITGISIKAAPSKTTYIKGENLDLTGGIITVTYEDESTAEMPITSNGVEIIGYNEQEEGEQEITVTYAGKTATFKVTVKNEITGISIKTAPSKTTYIKGENLDLTGGIIIVTYEDGSIEEISMTSNGVEITGYNGQEGEQTITVTYKGYSTTFTVSFNEEIKNEDNTSTIYESILPNAGFRTTIIVAILIMVILAIISYIKYRKCIF